LAIISIHIQVQASQNHDPLLIVKQANDFVRFSTAYFSISIATSLTTTILISLRILLVELSAIKAGIHSASGRNTYYAVIEIIVEAAVLYSITLLIMVCFISTKNGNLPYAQNIHAQVAVRTCND